jgi:hypothetical protein
MCGNNQGVFEIGKTDDDNIVPAMRQYVSRMTQTKNQPGLELCTLLWESRLDVTFKSSRRLAWPELLLAR